MVILSLRMGEQKHARQERCENHCGGCTDKDFSFDPASWIYLAVPGRYSGQANGMTDCDFYIIATPHQFLPKLLPEMLGKPLPGASAINLVKGVSVKGDEIELVSDTVESLLNIPCGALMGANIANDIAKENFCESTIAFTDAALGQKWVPLFHCKYFRIKLIQDLCLLQVCGTVKNIITLYGEP